MDNCLRIFNRERVGNASGRHTEELTQHLNSAGDVVELVE